MVIWTKSNCAYSSRSTISQSTNKTLPFHWRHDLTFQRVSVHLKTKRPFILLAHCWCKNIHSPSITSCSHVHRSCSEYVTLRSTSANSLQRWLSMKVNTQITTIPLHSTPLHFAARTSHRRWTPVVATPRDASSDTAGRRRHNWCPTQQLSGSDMRASWFFSGHFASLLSEHTTQKIYMDSAA